MRLIIGMSGATGAIYGIRLLQVLQDYGVETHLILSPWAEATIAVETSFTAEQVKKLASFTYASTNQAAVISSGSFITDGMAVVPCSMKTLAAISHGFSDNLISRAADVVLKERRKLVVVPREAPLSEIHLENMLRLARMGAVVLPPMPAFYTKPSTVDDIVNHTVSRILDQFGIDNHIAKRWLQ